MTFSVELRHAFSDMTLDIAFSAPASGITVLFGRSGCGKTSVVLAVAGLLAADQCRVAIGDRVLTDTAGKLFVRSEKRRIGLVFQDARLFPHMNVATNLRYGERRAPADATPAIGFDDVVELLGLTKLLDRRPHSLSGGERQRVAIGRALLSRPRLLAMDEPLASLDAERRSEILPYLLRLRKTLDLPILYVTHALDEAARLADTLVLIRAGRVLEAGRPADLLWRADLPFARRDEAAAVLDATVVSHDAARQLTVLHAGGQKLLIPLLDAATGTALRLRIPAREVILAATMPTGLSVHNVIPGIVRSIVEDPARHAAMVEVALDGEGLLARITPDAVTRLGLAPGRPVLALVKSMAIEVFSR